MIRPVAVIFIAALVAGCGKSYDPAEHLTVKEQDEVMSKVIRYISKPPEGISFEERFYNAYNEYYAEQQARHRLDAWYSDGTVDYFLISRAAPSMVEKRVAIGGKLQLDQEGNVSSYEEVFRTWKMIPDSLNRKGVFLFDKMVKSESLEPYLTKNSMPEEYIEFPDDNTYFDKEARVWKTKVGGQ